MESLITDTYITSFRAHERRDYKISFSDQDSLKPAVLYETLLSLFYDAV
jgi:competence transcription factor ComK